MRGDAAIHCKSSPVHGAASLIQRTCLPPCATCWHHWPCEERSVGCKAAKPANRAGSRPRRNVCIGGGTVFIPILDLLIGNRVLRVHRIPLLTEHCPLALDDLEQRRRHLRRRRSRIHKRPRTEIDAPSLGSSNNGDMR